MSFLKKILGGTPKNTGDSVETMKRRQMAAIEVLSIFQEHLPTTFESHPPTAMISAAWLAGTSLHRSFGYTPTIEPGTAVISEKADHEWPKMVNLYLSVIAKDGIRIDPNDVFSVLPDLNKKLSPEYKPKKEILQIQELFQDQYNQIMKKHGFDYVSGAQVGVFACAVMTQFHCIENKDLEPKLAAEIISLGFLEGANTAPIPLM